MRKSKKLSLPIKLLARHDIDFVLAQTINCIYYKNSGIIKNKFYKQERLCSRKQIELLFEQKNSANAFPIKAVFMNVEVDIPFPIQAMFVVPKRNFKKAHDRNKIRRRMREAYRLNKNSIYDELKPAGTKMLIAFIYTGKEEKDYLTVETSIKKLFVAIVDNKKK